MTVCEKEMLRYSAKTQRNRRNQREMLRNASQARSRALTSSSDILYNGKKHRSEPMKILVSNAGSTSLKFKLFDMDGEEALCDARVERVGSRDRAIFTYKNPVSYTHLDVYKRQGCAR